MKILLFEPIINKTQTIIAEEVTAQPYQPRKGADDEPPAPFIFHIYFFTRAKSTGTYSGTSSPLRYFSAASTAILPISLGF